MAAKLPEGAVNSDERAKNRPERVPLHRQHVLTALERPGFKRKFVNEVFGRVEAHIRAGWTIVHDAEKNNTSQSMVQDGSAVGTAVRVVVNKGLGAASHMAVLMEIPIEWAKEDYQAKQKENDDIEKSLHKPKVESGYGDVKIEYK